MKGKNPGKALRPKIQCPSCDHSWVPRTAAPKCCPKCHKPLSWPPQKEKRRGWAAKVRDLLLFSTPLLQVIQILLDILGIAGN